MRIKPDQRFKKNPMVMEKETAQGITLVDPYRHAVLELNPVATFLWKKLTGGDSFADAVEALIGEFDGERAVIEKDASECVSSLYEKELLL